MKPSRSGVDTAPGSLDGPGAVSKGPSALVRSRQLLDARASHHQKMTIWQVPLTQRLPPVHSEVVVHVCGPRVAVAMRYSFPVAARPSTRWFADWAEPQLKSGDPGGQVLMML